MTRPDPESGADADGDPRRLLEQAPSLDGQRPSVPDDSEVVFEAPWQARVFALTVALFDGDEADFEAFQRRLVDEIEADDRDQWGEETERAYYEHWLAAVERLLTESGQVSADDLYERVVEFDTEERDASEFVEGDRGHGHSHDHDHSH